MKKVMFCFARVVCLWLVNAATAGAGEKAGAQADPAAIEKGRHLIKITGCNDCHTAGYAMTGGKVAEAAWLTGDNLGWRGPWGTTYASNLRNLFQAMTEEQWIERARKTEMRPPMPWYSLRDMTDDELKSIYAFIRSLGAAGSPAPAYVPPEKEPSPPFVTFPAPPPAK